MIQSLCLEENSLEWAALVEVNGKRKPPTVQKKKQKLSSQLHRHCCTVISVSKLAEDEYRVKGD